MKRYVLCFLVISFSLIIGYEIVRIWRSMALSQQGSTKERLLQATKIDSFNPDPFHKLGALHEWDFLQVDLVESATYLQKAVEQNPLEQQYWISLAMIYQRMGEWGAFVRALENAIMVFPTSYRGRWAVGNLVLQQGNLEEALGHFSYILSHYPNRRSLVYEVWRKVVDSPDFILERLIPEDPSSLNQYLAYLYGVGDKESVKKTWEKLASLGYEADRSETIRYIDFLISCRELTEAAQVWNKRLDEEGRPVSSHGTPVTNGGFEREKLLGGGFDWRIGPVAGAEVSFDHSVAFEGKSSLKIAFDGKENIDFHHAYQYVALKPDIEYLLTAHMKTEAVTTKSGVRIEVLGLGPAFHGASESLTGDNDWKELAVDFRTPVHCQGAMIRVRRERTDKFDRFISGTVWLDEVQIREIDK